MADRAVVSALGYADPVTVRAPKFVAFAALHHAGHDLHLPQLSYEAVPVNESNCGERREIGNWIGLAYFCVDPGTAAAVPAPSP